MPEFVQNKAEKIVFEKLVWRNPFEIGFIKKLSGFSDKYKIRVGKYRIGITIDKRKKLLTCQRIAHRKDIYKVFP